MEAFVDRVIHSRALGKFVGDEENGLVFPVTSIKYILKHKKELMKRKNTVFMSEPYSPLLTKILVVLSNTNEFEIFIIKKRLCTSLSKNIEKLSVYEKPLVSAAKSTINEVMSMANNLLKPEPSILTEKEFAEIFKATCLTQNSDKIKEQVGKDQYEEFQSRKHFYMKRYKTTVGEKVTEVQKQLSG